jgi:hypothetical protein
VSALLSTQQTLLLLHLLLRLLLLSSLGHWLNLR